MVRQVLSGRFVLSPMVGFIAIGDVILIATFISLGQLHHGVSPLTGLDTIGEFLLGWFIVVPFTGVYSARAFDSLQAAAIRLVASWIPADLLGVLLRATIEPGASLAPTFILVTLTTGLVFLLPWRVIVAWYLERTDNALAHMYRRSVL